MTLVHETRRALLRVESIHSPSSYAATLAPDIGGCPTVVENARVVTTDSDHRRVMDWAWTLMGGGSRFSMLAEADLRDLD